MSGAVFSCFQWFKPTAMAMSKLIRAVDSLMFLMPQDLLTDNSSGGVFIKRNDPVGHCQETAMERSPKEDLRCKIETEVRGLGLPISDELLDKISQYFQIEGDKWECTRSEKIADIVSRIRAGKYLIPAEDIANRVMSRTSLLHLAQVLDERVAPGREGWQDFQDIGAVVTSRVFENELTHPVEQVRGGGTHKSIYDLVFYNSASSGFWEHMRQSHRVSHVVFEFKNSERLSRHDLDQLRRYSDCTNRGIVVVNRAEQPLPVIRELAGLMKHDRIVLSVNAADLRTATSYYLAGKPAGDALIPAYTRLVTAA